MGQHMWLFNQVDACVIGDAPSFPAFVDMFSVVQSLSDGVKGVKFDKRLVMAQLSSLARGATRGVTPSLLDQLWGRFSGNPAPRLQKLWYVPGPRLRAPPSTEVLVVV